VLHLQHDAITVVTEGGNGEEVSGIIYVGALPQKRIFYQPGTYQKWCFVIWPGSE